MTNMNWTCIDRNGNFITGEYDDGVLTISWNGSILKQFGAENWRDAQFSFADWASENRCTTPFRSR